MVGDMNQPAGASRPQTGLFVIFLTVFIDLVGFSVIFPLFPQLLLYYLGLDGQDGTLGSFVGVLEQFAGGTDGAGDFRVTVLFGGILGSLYAVLSFVFAPYWGRLSDRLGRRRVLLITVTGTALSYVLWFFAGNFWLLVAARFLGGVMSGNISVANAAMADVTTAENRAKGMGAIGAAFGLGFILGPAMGGLLSTIDLTTVLPGVPGVNPFSAAALGTLLLSAVNLIWVWRRFAETLAPGSQKSAQHAHRPRNPIAAMLKVDIAEVNRANLLFFIYTLAFTGMEFTLTFLAKERFAYTSLKNALLFTYVGFIIAIVQGGVVRRVAPRFGEKNLTIGGIVLIIPGLVVAGFAAAEWALYLGLGLLSVGSALANPSLTALVSLYSPDDRQGEILGTFRALGSLARAVGPIVASLLYFRFGSGSPYFVAALVMVVPALISLGLPKPKHGAGG